MDSKLLGHNLSRGEGIKFENLEVIPKKPNAQMGAACH